MFKKWGLFFYPLIFVSAVFVAASGQVKKEFGFDNPEIKTIQNLYKSIEKLSNKGRLTERSRIFSYCNSYFDTDRKLYSDSSGKIRKYVRSGGSDDSTATQTFFYDEEGNLRLCVVGAGAINGTKMEVRIYFDKNKNRIWEDRKFTEGPGYPFPNPWPEELIVYHPKEAFESKHECEDE